MKENIYKFITIILFSILMNTTVQAYALYDVSGYVKTDEGYPVLSSVTLSGVGGNSYTSTDNTGYYEFLDIQEGDVQVSTEPSTAFLSDGTSVSIYNFHETITRTNFSLSGDVILDDIVVDTVYLKGTILDSDGSPVSDVSLSIDFTNTTTDENGFYIIAFPLSGFLFVEGGYANVTVTPPSSRPELGVTSFSVDMNNGDVEHNTTVQAYSFYDVSGYVKTDEGYPVLSSVTLSGVGGNSYTSTDNTGYYEFLDIQEGDVQVSTEPSTAFLSDGTSVSIYNFHETITRTNFSLSGDVILDDIVVDTVYLKGTILDSDGSPVSDVSLSIDFTNTTTDENGFYIIAFPLSGFLFVEGGYANVTVTPPSSRPELGVTSFSVDMNNGDVEHITIIGDLDADGMSDEYEDLHGLDKTNPLDADEDLDDDGYTNKEEYDAGTDPEDPTDVPVVSNANLNPSVIMYLLN